MGASKSPNARKAKKESAGPQKKGAPKNSAIAKKLKAPIGTKVGPNAVKDVYDSATPDKILSDPLGRRKKNQ